MKKILVVGGGGREHTLAWKLANDSDAPRLFCAPGNAGTRAVATNVDIGAEELEELIEWAKREKPDLTVVGPEAPLCAGITDLFEAEGLAVFGPSKAAARIEGSKVFAKDVMRAAGVPTAASAAFTDMNEALRYVREQGAPLVVKADGLAAGKGVAVCGTVEQAEEAVRTTMQDHAFGDAGDEVLIEEFLTGQEASILAMVDGERAVMLASSQDHKRIFNGDNGPNTGGMGAYSPAPIVTEELWPVIRSTVIEPTLAELKQRGIVYRGVLYAGLMIHDNDIKVLEFNCRFGDPETQVVIPRIAGDLGPALKACADGTLSEDLIQWKPQECVCVVMASGGYPGSYQKGKVIEGLEKANAMEDVVVFHAGTRDEGDAVVTSGGRVLGITALGETLHDAIDTAYEAIRRISFDQAQYRTDIAAKAPRRR